MFDREQFLRLVIRPALEKLPTNMQGHVSEQLLLGTAAVESRLGTYLHQVGGPALGVFQVEPATHLDLYQNYLAFRPQLRRAMLYTAHRDCADGELNKVHFHKLHDELITNLIYSAMVARLVYYRAPEPLPGSEDPYELGEYWKRHYNTSHGKGTVAKFLQAWRSCHS